jgi:hypothetical protein
VHHQQQPPEAKGPPWTPQTGTKRGRGCCYGGGWVGGCQETMDRAKLHRAAQKQVNVPCRPRAEGKNRAARWPVQRFDGQEPRQIRGKRADAGKKIAPTWERLGAAVVLVHALGIDGGPAATAHRSASCQGMGCKARDVQINPHPKGATASSLTREETVINFRPTTLLITATCLDPQGLPGAPHLSSPPSVRTWSRLVVAICSPLRICRGLMMGF